MTVRFRFILKMQQSAMGACGNGHTHHAATHNQASWVHSRSQALNHAASVNMLIWRRAQASR